MKLRSFWNAAGIPCVIWDVPNDRLRDQVRMVKELQYKKYTTTLTMLLKLHMSGPALGLQALQCSQDPPPPAPGLALHRIGL